MKKLILTLMIAMIGTMGFTQTFIYADTVVNSMGEDTLITNYYHVSFLDNDMPFQLVNVTSRVESRHTADTVVSSVMTFKPWPLAQGDSAYNPFNDTWYSYTTVKDHIYSIDETMKRELSKWYIKNWFERRIK